MHRYTVVLTSAEVSPFAATGELGTTVASIAASLAARGHTVHLFLPRFTGVFDTAAEFIRYPEALHVTYPGYSFEAAVYTALPAENLSVHAIEHNMLFERDSLYGPPYQDNCERFSFFSHAVLHALALLNITPDIIHCFDWHTALIPVLARTLYADSGNLRLTKTVLTIHSMEHLGRFPVHSAGATGLGWDAVTEDNLKHYDTISLLKGGMQYADMLSTVSPSYAAEIQHPGIYGSLAGIIHKRGITPVANGFNRASWDPSRDDGIPAYYSYHDMAGKQHCKSALQRQLGLPLDETALFIGLISPFTEENMMPDAAAVIGYAAAHTHIQCVLMGDGSDAQHRIPAFLHSILPDRCVVYRGFDTSLERKIYAGTDALIIPPVFAYTGQQHFRACAYGSVPIAAQTALLADTMTDFRSNQQQGNCFFFERNNSISLGETLAAFYTLYTHGTDLSSLQYTCMTQIWSWDTAVSAYEALYAASRSPRLSQQYLS